MTLDEAKKIIKSECYIADLLNLDRTRMVNTALDTVIEAAEQTRWIPCSERLPELHEASPLLKKFVNKVSDEVLVTIEDKKNGTRTVSSKCYLWDNLWHGDIFNWLKASKCDFEIIAWMPLPQPYKAEGSDEE